MVNWTLKKVWFQTLSQCKRDISNSRILYSTDWQLLTFQDNPLVPFSRFKQLLKMEPTGCPETSVTNYRCMLPNIPKERISQYTDVWLYKWETEWCTLHWDASVQNNYNGDPPSSTQKQIYAVISIPTDSFSHILTWYSTNSLFLSCYSMLTSNRWFSAIKIYFRKLFKKEW